MLETLAQGYSSDRTKQELSNEYQVRWALELVYLSSTVVQYIFAN